MEDSAAAGPGVDVTTGNQRHYYVYGLPDGSYFDPQLQAEVVSQTLTYRFARANVRGRFIYTLADNPRGHEYEGLYYSDARGNPTHRKPSTVAFMHAARKAKAV